MSPIGTHKADPEASEVETPKHLSIEAAKGGFVIHHGPETHVAKTHAQVHKVVRQFVQAHAPIKSNDDYQPGGNPDNGTTPSQGT